MPRKQWNYDLAVLQRLWAAGKTHIEIAAALGCAEKQVEQLRRRHALPRRPRKQAPPVTVDPTPEQIATGAKELRQRHMEQMQRETPDASRARANRNAQVSDAIRRYSWDGFRFSGI